MRNSSHSSAWFCDKIDEDTYDTLEEVLNKWAEKCGISVNYDEDF